MNSQIATVLGGTGFLGRRIVRHLHEQGLTVRIASRDVQTSRELFGTADPRLLSIQADIHDERSLEGAVAGAYAAVNAISLYTERGKATFRSTHVDGARRFAAAAHRAGVERFVLLSGIGADAASHSPYIRSRGEGEAAVRAAFPGAFVIRPAVMFAPDDAFVTVIIRLLRQLRIVPMFGNGHTKLQPVHVEDVAEAIARMLQQSTPSSANTFECGGPRVYSYRDLLRTIAVESGLKPLLIPMPFPVWHALARTAEFLPTPPVTRNQIELMQIDTIASPQFPGLKELGITPQPLEATVRQVADRR